MINMTGCTNYDILHESNLWDYSLINTQICIALESYTIFCRLDEN